MLEFEVQGLNRVRNHAETLAFSVSLFEKSSTLTCCTREQKAWEAAPSSSTRFLEILTLTLWGRLRTPWFQMNWLSLGSMRTSSVFIILWTSFLISLMALGALRLNWVRWASLWMLIVVSIATSDGPYLFSFFAITTNLLQYQIFNYLHFSEYSIVWMFLQISYGYNCREARKQCPKEKNSLQFRYNSAI